MIISASYKTDIPTFYGDWFMNRLRAGSCKMVNPYNRQSHTIDLTLDNVEGIVFWTKNIGPFLKHLEEIQERGYTFIIQHTITGYPHELEAKVVNSTQTIDSLRKIADLYGPDIIVWRYDPILISSITPFKWHLQNFENLAKAMEGVTNEVVISFTQTYKKTKHNVETAAQSFGFEWQASESFPDTQLKAFASELSTMAKEHKIQLKACSQKFLLTPGIIEEARCVDAERLGRISQKPFVQTVKLQGNRKECGCFTSKDIGEYDTCPHGCVYCYAVQKREKALARYKAHDPDSPFLFLPDNISANLTEPLSVIPPPKRRKALRDELVQRDLFSS